MEDNRFHLLNKENQTFQFEKKFHNEILLIFYSKESTHILKTEHSSFETEDKLLKTSNDILEFINEIKGGEKEKEGEEIEVIILSDKILKHYIDYLKGVVENYKNIYVFEYGDILYPRKTLHKEDPIEIIYQVNPRILLVSGHSSMMTDRKVYHVFYNGLMTEYHYSFFT